MLIALLMTMAITAQAETPDLESGATTYTQFCVACHQADGTGMNGLLAVNLVKSDRLKKTDEQLLVSIRQGLTGSIGVMPAWGSALSDEQTVNVLAYLRNKYGKPAE